MPGRAASELEEVTGVKVPYTLQPTTNLYRVGNLLRNVGSEGAPPEFEVESFDQFFGQGADGHYMFGTVTRPDFGEDFFLQRRVRDKSLFLQFDLQPDDDTEEGTLKAINRYLYHLAALFEETSRRGLDVEVAETPTTNEYRIYGPDGNGVVFQESILNAADQGKALHDLIGRWAVLMAERNTN